MQSFPFALPIACVINCQTSHPSNQCFLHPLCDILISTSPGTGGRICTTKCLADWSALELAGHELYRSSLRVSGSPFLLLSVQRSRTVNTKGRGRASANIKSAKDRTANPPQLSSASAPITRKRSRTLSASRPRPSPRLGAAHIISPPRPPSFTSSPAHTQSTTNRPASALRQSVKPLVPTGPPSFVFTQPPFVHCTSSTPRAVASTTLTRAAPPPRFSLFASPLPAPRLTGVEDAVVLLRNSPFRLCCAFDAVRARFSCSGFTSTLLCHFERGGFSFSSAAVPEDLQVFLSSSEDAGLGWAGSRSDIQLRWRSR